MNKLLCCGLLLLGSAAVWAQAPAVATPTEAAPAAPVVSKVVMHTALGDITLDIETERAPITAANFLHYVDQKRFDGMTFYRAMKIGDTGEYGLVQAGLRGDPKKLFKPIAHEPTTQTGLSHVSGAISMARLEPGSATADFFIVLGNLSALDAHPGAEPPQGDNLGYAVFGRVTDGMDVIKQILEQPRSLTAGEGVMLGQMLEPQIKVLAVRRVETSQ